MKNSVTSFFIRVREYNQDLLTHLISMTDDERRLRFFHSASDDYIRDYYRKTVERSDTWVVNYRLVGIQYVIVGALHAAVDADFKSAELGFSVNTGYSGQGIATELMSRTISILKNLGVQSIILYCLSENAAVKKICVKHGMRVIGFSPESESTLDLDETIEFSDIVNISTTPSPIGTGLFSIFNQWIGKFSPRFYGNNQPDHGRCDSK